jgi:hypothetical protein
MIEPTMIKLSMEILDKLAIKEIIYAEYAYPGAMGNAGGVMIYSITDGNFNCYEANIFTDEKVYNKVVDILERNQITSRYNDVENKKGIFKLYGGGMGNNALINKDVSFKISNGYFIYTKNNMEYIICSSARDVFDRVAFEIRRQSPEYRKKIRRLTDYMNEAIDEKEKQNKLLYEKLNKEIITGKIYTEKEINAILRMCCTLYLPNQDYVLFRRGLIDNGYLCRTNDCRAYWRNVNK